LRRSRARRSTRATTTATRPPGCRRSSLFADAFGRRRTLFWTIAGYTFFTGATAFAPDERTFAVCQFLAWSFGAAEGTLAAVVVAEEIDPDQRGWALGVLGSLASLGVALAWVLFAFVDALPLGWRTLYLVGLGPLAIVAYLRRNLPETQRFERWRREAPGAAGLSQVLRPLVSLVRAYPARFAAVCGVIFLLSFSGQAAGFFFPKHLQDAHGLEPAQFTMLGAAIGSLALVASPIFGRLGDRRGRKPVAVFFVVANPLTVIALYHSPGLVVVALAAAAMLLTDIGSDTNLGAFAKELFPTSYRSTADAARSVVGQLGGSLGLACESLLFAGLGAHALAISALALVGLAAPVIVARAFPETSGRPLEEISPERT
jgi:MFS family permease